MGYRSIENLYRDARILEFKRGYAVEKIHGTSSHVSFKPEMPIERRFKPELNFFAGGTSHVNFVQLFSQEELREKFVALGHEREIVVHGEAYGGKQQGMSHTYGKDLSFCGFEVRIGDVWLAVPQAEEVCNKLGLEFAPYKEIEFTIEAVNAERDADSIIAVRRGMGPGKKREGVVLRPPFEVTLNNGERLIAKHKRDDFAERATPVRDIDPEKLKVYAGAEAAAEEFVVPMRLVHVLDKLQAALGRPAGVGDMPKVLAAMVEDVTREAKGEIVESKETVKAIQNHTRKLFMTHLKKDLK